LHKKKSKERNNKKQETQKKTWKLQQVETK
jgi:hypothetical protein